MELKKLKETQERLAWPSDSNDLPVVSWESCTLFSNLPFTVDLSLTVHLKTRSKPSNALSFSFLGSSTTRQILLTSTLVAPIC